MATETNKAFIAYPNNPKEINDAISSATEKLKANGHPLSISLWISHDIPGRVLTAPIFENIEECNVLIADISVMNFNVIYEIGYSIGRQKRVFLIRNASIELDDHKLVEKIGVFDTIGYAQYNNSDDLSKILSNISDFKPINFDDKIIRISPIYVLQTPIFDEYMSRMISTIKKFGHKFRSFNPSEQGRLSATEAISQVASSTGVLVPYLGVDSKDANIHNYRAAFTAGLSHGMGKETLILTRMGVSTPLDIRDVTKTFATLDEITLRLNDFCSNVLKLASSKIDKTSSKIQDRRILHTLSLGSSTAENEAITLESYYLETQEFLVASRGEVNVITGRKGTGKTALFLRIRDIIRRDKNNIVLDFKPEGYQLLKFKDEILQHLAQGSAVHMVVAFWEYVLLLEVCRKLLEKDQEKHIRDHHLFDLYRKMKDAFDSEILINEGDFSERLTRLMDEISKRYAKIKSDDNQSLSNDEVTQILHCHDLTLLKNILFDYLSLKGDTWILFDNLDKGWSARGVTEIDLQMMNALITACEKIEREMQRKDLSFHAIVFLRHDIYHKMIDATSDRGKDRRITLEWTDKSLLKRLIHNRITLDNKLAHLSIDHAWASIACHEVCGEPSFDYILTHSLMRPRYLLNILTYSKTCALNHNHDIIEEDDFISGVKTHSNELIIATDYEICDILPSAQDAIYLFINEYYLIEKDKIFQLLSESSYDEAFTLEFMKALIWCGFLGIVDSQGREHYIYDMGYDYSKFEALSRKTHQTNPIFAINQAYRLGLDIKDH